MPIPHHNCRLLNSVRFRYRYIYSNIGEINLLDHPKGVGYLSRRRYLNDPMSITIKDVAAAAGVGVGTVSRVLSGSASVSHAKRCRVEEEVARLNYVPNNLAGALSSRRSGIVAIIVPTLEQSIFAETVDGAESEFNAHGLQVMIGQAKYDLEREAALVKTFLKLRPEGLILTGSNHLPLVHDLLRTSGTPVAECWGRTENPIGISVGFDNRSAAREIVTHLIERGRRNIAMLCAPRAFDPRLYQRIEGYEEALKMAGLPPRVHDRIDGSSTYSGFHQSGKVLDEILKHHPETDAIFCSDDFNAVGALFRCQQRGIWVPNELAIAGFVDLPIASGITPAVTTVRVPRWEIGATAARHLVAMAQGEPITQAVIDLGYEIVVRETT